MITLVIAVICFFVFFAILRKEETAFERIFFPFLFAFFVFFIITVILGHLLPGEMILESTEKIEQFEEGHWVLVVDDEIHFQRKCSLHGKNHGFHTDAYNSHINESDTCTAPMVTVYGKSSFLRNLFLLKTFGHRTIISVPKGTVKTISEKEGN